MSNPKPTSEYNFKEIEKKWKEKWEADKIYQPDLDKAKKPFYNLMMFPYPSAEGLHIGGVYTFTGVDTFGRYKKMQGYDVFEPIGLDGFGIHSENYAMKIGEHIKEVSKRTEKNFYRQLSSIGNMYDWSRTVETYKPEYYKWTQWLFLQLFKKGLAYQKEAKVNWCPWCKTVLSDEQVIQGLCERCDSQVEKRELKQWFFKITDYAERLLKNLDWIDWSEDVKTNQKNWIGKSEGARVKFEVNNKKEDVLILHGWEDSSQAGWIPETKKQLEKIGHKVFAYDAPNAVKPVFEEWFEFIENKIKENKLKDFTIIGHSMGGFLACKLAEKYKLKKIVLVVPVGPQGSKEYLKEFESKIEPEEMEVFRKYQDRTLNIEKMKQNVYEIHFIFGEKDPWITKEIREFYQKNFPEARTQVLKGMGHISRDEGVKKCEQLENLFIGYEENQSTNQIEVFTTRPDTLFGATYMVLAPEHQLIEKIKDQIKNWDEVKKYIDQAKAKSEQERKEDEKAKTGVEVQGIKAINPANNEEIPIWIADYVLAGYGTGAIMAVPAHDERDFEFAKKYNIPIKQVVTLAKKEDYESTKNTLKNLKVILDEAEKNNLKIWLLGGLAFVFNCGFVYRKHDDIDLAVKSIDDFEKAIKMLRKLGFQKIKEKKLENKYAYVFKNKEDLEVELYLKLPNLSEEDFEEQIFSIQGIKARTLSKKFLKNIKKNQSETRNENKDKIDLEVFNNKSFTAEGISINSDFLDGLKTEEAKKKMIKWLEKEDVGKKSIDYKLRDWCVSRQRYWGPPIPIVWCENCAKEKIKKEEIKLKINFYDQEVWRSLVSGKKTVETRALNPEEENRYFGDLKENELLLCDNKETNQEIIFKVIDVRKYKNLEEFFNDKEYLKKASLGKMTSDIEKLKEKYARFSKNYLERIEKNGLVAWEIEKIKIPVAIPEEDLPVELPEMEDFLPEGKGKGPLAKNQEFVKTKCPKCGAEAERETDVSDPFVDSAWYFLRYPSTEFENEAINKERSKKWLPVDSYIGGKEHTVLHLLYSRFITMVLKDLDYIDFEEPYKKFFGHGLITKDGAKMSKSKGNVINPDEMIEKYGVDTVRLYLRFLGDFSQGGDWRDDGADGMSRFVKKVWQTFHELQGAGQRVEKTQIIDKTVKVIGEDLEKLSFNTAVARYMEFINWVRENSDKFNQDQVRKIKKTMALVLAPLAPHIAEEFWAELGNEKSIFTENWPEFDENNLEDDQFELVIQVNGKVRDRMKVSRQITQEEAEKKALESEKIAKHLNGQKPKKIIYIKEKLINIVI